MDEGHGGGRILRIVSFFVFKGSLDDMYKRLKERERIRKKVQDKFEASDSAFFLLAR